jgi:hypothetical protein
MCGMRITAIKLARVIALFDSDELTPYGGVSTTKVAAEIAKKFEFQKYPRPGEEFDNKKGIEFLDGIWESTPVTKLTIYNDGIIIDTRHSTSRSLQILAESLHWAKMELGLHFEDDMLRRTRYLSSFSFFSEVPILKHSQAINNASKTMAELMESITGQSREYEGTEIDLDFDHSSNRDALAPFTIQRLGVEPFKSNRYYTQAPVPTEALIALVEQFEADVLAI